MAEAVVSIVVEQLTDLLLKQAKEEIDLLTGVEKKVLNLSTTFKRIQAVLADAERKMITEETVKAWLRDLEDVSYDIDDVLDEWNYTILRQQIEGTSSYNASPSIRKQRVCSFIPSSCSCFKQVFVNRDIALKIKELSGRLDLIEKQKNQFSFITSSGVASNSQERKRVESTSFVDVSEVVGRFFDKKTLVSQLLSKSRPIQILSIIGTGGIGKTTLAQIAYNDDQVKYHFEKRGWVCVSDPFDEIRVAKAIIQSLESSSPNLNELDPLLQRIRDSSFGKRFLLVLDDVWTEDQIKWEPFKNSLKHGAPGSTILLTTRSERVARVAGATSMIHLGVLSHSDSWSLFRQIAFSGRDEMECERLEDVAKEIAGRCKGLPLAIKIIGSLLHFKDTVEGWETVKNSNIWELEVAEVDLFPHFYLSYKDLASPIRRCFSYCAVFPKDEKIGVDDLIRIWMAQGFVNSSGSEYEMELKGNEYFDHLAKRSLFQDFEFHILDGRISTCKMHDIVHDFAQFLMRRECLIIEGERKEKLCENARHLTWLGREEANEEATDTLFDRNMGQPRSFYAKDLKSDTFTIHVLNSLKLVRVLKLYGCGLKVLPAEIGNLIHLRYLYLAYNFDLKELPATVYELYNLQTLHLQSCDIKELPLGIKKLTKLRHLVCFGKHNMKYPEEIGELTCLQTLSHFSVGRGYNKLGDLKNLNQLRGSLCIHIMNNLDDVADTNNADLKSKHIQTLLLVFHNSAKVKEDVMEALEPPSNLLALQVRDYGETRLPTWLTSLNNLRNLMLYDCFGLTSLPPLGILPFLEELHMVCLPLLKLVGPAYFGIRESSPLPAIVFPKLKELNISDFRKWEVWEDIGPEEKDDGTVPIIFPRLRRLKIEGCPNLKALPNRLLRKASSLECIQLDSKRYNPSTILATTITIAEIKARQSDHQSPSTEEGPQLESLPNMIAGIWSSDSRFLLEAASQLNNLLCIGESRPIEEVIQSGVVPRFVEFLKWENFPQLQFVAAAVLANITGGTSENKRVVIDHGAVPILIMLLGSPRDDFRWEALLALGNIAADSIECRNLVLGHGAMMPLLFLLNEHAAFPILEIATWTLSVFCRSEPLPQFEQVKPALPVLQRLIYSDYEEVLKNACRALSFLSEGTNDLIQAVIEAGVCQRLVELLLHQSPSVLSPALWTIGNIVKGDAVQTQCIIDHGALPCLLSLLTHNHEMSIKEYTCWTISNITAGNRDQIQAVIEDGLIVPLINLLQTAEFDVKKWAALAISNVTSGGTHDQIKFLVSQGCINPLCDLLICHDTWSIKVCLETLENILKVGEVEKNQGNTGDLNYFAQLIDQAEGLEKIKNLQFHGNNEIYEIAVKILETHWLEEEDKTLPEGNQAGFNFGGY